MSTNDALARQASRPHFDEEFRWQIRFPCKYELGVQSTKHLPPCPECGNGHWNPLSGGDSANDPYPGR